MGPSKSRLASRSTSIDPWLLPLTLLGSVATIVSGWTWEVKNSIHFHDSLSRQFDTTLLLLSVPVVFLFIMMLLGMVYSVTPLARRVFGYLCATTIITVLFGVAAGGLRSPDFIVVFFGKVPDDFWDIVSTMTLIAASFVVSGFVLNSLMIPVRWLTIQTDSDKHWLAIFRPSRLQLVLAAAAFLIAWASVKTQVLDFAEFGEFGEIIVVPAVAAVMAHFFMLILSLANQRRYINVLLFSGWLVSVFALTARIFPFRMSFGIPQISLRDLLLLAGVLSIHLTLWVSRRLPFTLKKVAPQEEISQPIPVRFQRRMATGIAFCLLLATAHFTPLFYDVPLGTILAGTNSSLGWEVARIRRLEGTLFFADDTGYRQPRLDFADPTAPNPSLVIEQAAMDSDSWRAILEDAITHNSMVIRCEGAIRDLELLELLAGRTPDIRIDGNRFEVTDLQSIKSLTNYHSVRFDNTTITPIWLQKFPSQYYLFADCEFPNGLKSTDLPFPGSYCRANFQGIPLDNELLELSRAFTDFYWILTRVEEIQLDESSMWSYITRKSIWSTHTTPYRDLASFRDALTERCRNLGYSDSLIELLNTKADHYSLEGKAATFGIYHFILGQSPELPANSDLAAFATDSQRRLLRYTPQDLLKPAPQLNWNFLALDQARELVWPSALELELNKISQSELDLSSLERFTLDVVSPSLNDRFLWKVPHEQLEKLVLTSELRRYLSALRPWSNLKELRIAVSVNPHPKIIRQLQTAPRLETLHLQLDVPAIDFSDDEFWEKVKNRWEIVLREAGIQAKTTLVFSRTQLLGIESILDEELPRLELDLSKPSD